MASPSFFLSGVSHLERQQGEHISIDHLAELHEQHQSENARLIEAQQAAASRAAALKEDDAQQYSQQQYAMLLALQQQRAAAAARTGAAGPGGGPSALAQNVYPQGSHGAAARGVGRPAKHQHPKEEEEDGEDDTDQWVQCCKCQQWRQVPDEFWPDIANGDEDEDWHCKDALWAVEDYEPGTPACNS